MAAFPQIAETSKATDSIFLAFSLVSYFYLQIMIINIQDTPLVGNSQDVLGPCDGIQRIAVSLSARTSLTGEGCSPRLPP